MNLRKFQKVFYLQKFQDVEENDKTNFEKLSGSIIS